MSCCFFAAHHANKMNWELQKKCRSIYFQFDFVLHNFYRILFFINLLKKERLNLFFKKKNFDSIEVTVCNSTDNGMYISIHVVYIYLHFT